MSRLKLRDRIRQGVFVLDGAMGTQLFARGVEPGSCNDLLDVKSPDIVLDIHRAYFEAGSDAVLTNTFGANRYALARHGCADRAFEINKAGAEVARRAAGEDRYVLGDVGPTGEPGTIDANGRFELRFKIRVGSFVDFYYRGTMDNTGQTLTGTLHGSGFSGEVLILSKSK